MPSEDPKWLSGGQSLTIIAPGGMILQCSNGSRSITLFLKFANATVFFEINCNKRFKKCFWGLFKVLKLFLLQQSALFWF